MLTQRYAVVHLHVRAGDQRFGDVGVDVAEIADALPEDLAVGAALDQGTGRGVAVVQAQGQIDVDRYRVDLVGDLDVVVVEAAGEAGEEAGRERQAQGERGGGLRS